MTKRQEKRDERAASKLVRADWRRDLEARKLRTRRNLPFESAAGVNGQRWTPIPGSSYECNQFGNVREKARAP